MQGAISLNEQLLAANKHTAVRFLEAAAAYRTEECLDSMTDDATWWVLGDPRRLKVAGSKNRAQVQRLLQVLAHFVPVPMTLTIRGLTAEGSRVAVEAECRGVWRDGAVYHNTYHFLFELREGKVAAVREYMDTLLLSRFVDSGDAAEPR